VVTVYRTRSGKFVVHAVRSPDWIQKGPDGKPGGWRTWLGLGDYTFVASTGESTLEVVDTIDELREKLPAELFETVAAAARQPAVEDLDI